MSEINACETCPAYHAGNLKKLGVHMEGYDYLIALAGNPNTGKSTVFNNLTGLRQHTGNWPGKTVTRAEGAFSYNERKFKLVDLPGTYSLLSTSTDEEIARDFLLFGKPDVSIVVVDATRVERNLNLVLQILEITDRLVVCLNLIDEAKRHNMIIDDRQLSRELGIPVIPTAARSKTGMDALLKSVYDVATGVYVCKPHRVKNTSPKLTHIIDTLTKKILSHFPNLPNARWVALRLLEGDQRIADAIKSGELGNLHAPSGIDEKAESYGYAEI
jgi:Fe2+ transport system protein B